MSEERKQLKIQYFSQNCLQRMLDLSLNADNENEEL